MINSARVMISRQLRVLFIAALTLAVLNLMAAPARAHDAPYTLSTVAWNAQTKAIEVVHRVHAHHVVDHLVPPGPQQTLGLSSLENLAHIGVYTNRNFGLMGENEHPIALEFIGAEAEGDFVYLYQEALSNAPPVIVAARSDLMRNVFAAQVNQVNIDALFVGGTDKTLLFPRERAGDWQFLTPTPTPPNTDVR